MGLLFIQQEIHCPNDFDAVLVLGEVTFHGNDDLLVVIRDLAKGGQLPFSGFGGVHGFGDLDILLLIGFGGDEVHFLVVQPADKV